MPVGSAVSDDDEGHRSSVMPEESSLPSVLPGGGRQASHDANAKPRRRWDAPVGEGGPSARFTRVTVGGGTASVPSVAAAAAASSPSAARSRSHAWSESVVRRPRASNRDNTRHHRPNRHEPPPTQTTHVDPQRLAPESSGLDLVGSIVERPKSRKKKASVSVGRQGGRGPPTKSSGLGGGMLPPSSHSAGATTAFGFPSLDAPFGTFAGRRAAGAPAQAATTYGADRPGTASAGAGAGASPTTAALREAAAHDADAMLAGMSVDEIRHERDELRKLLSGDTLAFLQKRHVARKTTQHQQPTPATTTPATTTWTSEEPDPRPSRGDNEMPSRNDVKDSDALDVVMSYALPDTTTRTAPANESLGVTNQEVGVGQGSDGQQSEKERLARVLTSIHTYQDLDAACEAEMARGGADDGEGIEGGGAAGGGMDDFAVACELLRSSARRQTIWAAKAVVDRLRRDLDSGAHCSLPEQVTGVAEPPPWPYPVLLPVSLRCLLDASSTGAHGYVLHTHVLQAIYYLLQLRACNSHVVNLMMSEGSAQAIHQLYFMDDALVSPRMSACYSGDVPVTVDVPGASPNVSVSGTVYNTSSQSAQSDGLSFAGDPMWTLLSKMRLVPRLASLLRIPSQALPTETAPLSEEALVSIGGILAMLAMRSPGAAVAIAQHETLVPDIIVRSTLVPAPAGTAAALDPKLAVPAVRLLCCLAQQSRTAAEAIDVYAFLFPVLATAVDLPPDEGLHRLRVWTLTLWRTLLRYGIGLDLTPTLLSLCVSHVTLGPSPTSLGPELFSAMANVARCVRVTNQRRDITARGSPVLKETMELLCGSDVWVSSTWRHAMKHIENGQMSLDDDHQGTQLDALRFYGSCMRFMESYVALHLVDGSEMNGKSDAIGLGTFNEVSVVSSLSAIVKSDRFRDFLHKAMIGIFMRQAESKPTLEKQRHEAAALYFLDSLTLLLRQLCNFSAEGTTSGMRDSASINSLVSSLTEALFEELMAAIGTGNAAPLCAQDAGCRSAWQIRLLFAMCNLWASLNNDRHKEMTRALSLCTIGTLQCGDECRAAALVSHDWLFDCSTSGLHEGSMLSSFLLRELCRSPSARNQLDHSFKLSGGFGITTEGFGAFELQSLRSEADHLQPMGDPTSGLRLPLGRLWLWQLLSGVIVIEDGNPDSGEGSNKEVAEILSATLELLVHLETSKDLFARWYTNAVGTGIKLYHFVNVCLQPEIVFQRNMIQTSLASLLDVFVGTKGNWAPEFIDACTSHSSPKANRQSNSTSSSSPTSEYTADDSRTSLNRIFDESIRALEDFVGDLCAAFIEFGAQYATFTRCMRLFLLPCFPPAIRCLVLDKLRGIAHLLTLEGEDLTELLSQYLHGGLPSVDNSSREAPEFVDFLCKYRRNTPFVRGETAELVHLLTVAVLVRSLAYCIVAAADEAPGSLLNWQRRLALQDEALRIQVIQGTAVFLSSNGTLADLLNVTISTNCKINCELKPSLIAALLDEPDWNGLWMTLRASVSDKLVVGTSIIPLTTFPVA